MAGVCVASLIAALLLVSLHAGRGFEWRHATLAELRGRYQPPELCVIALLAQNSSQILPIRVAELSELLTDPACINKSLAEVWLELSKRNDRHTNTITGSGTYSHGHRWRPIAVKYPEGQCGMSDDDRVPFFTSAWDIPTGRTNISTAAKLYHTLLTYNRSKIMRFGDSLIGQVRHDLEDNWKDLNTLRKISNEESQVLPCGLMKIGVMAKEKTTCPTSNNYLCTDKLNALFLKEKVVPEMLHKIIRNLTWLL
jgi:hypothetical protein